jgi:hypothetical protein
MSSYAYWIPLYLNRIPFLIDQDPCHKRFELLRELFFNPKSTPEEVCFRFGISMPTYYRLVADYKLYGQWAVIPALSPGKQSLSAKLQLAIILEKLKHPKWSPETIIKTHRLNVSRFAVLRVIKRWALENKDRIPIALDEYLDKETLPSKPFSAFEKRLSHSIGGKHSWYKKDKSAF